jgi:hypothetical protein
MRKSIIRIADQPLCKKSLLFIKISLDYNLNTLDVKKIIKKLEKLIICGVIHYTFLNSKISCNCPASVARCHLRTPGMTGRKEWEQALQRYFQSLIQT